MIPFVGLEPRVNLERAIFKGHTRSMVLSNAIAISTNRLDRRSALVIEARIMPGYNASQS